VKAYGSSGIYSGLIFKTARLDGSSVRIAFDFAGNGLKTTENKPVKGFALADESGKWVWADAKIVCNDIVVETGHALSLPVVSVQYAWQSNPDCNLYNTEGLPAVPFKVNLKH
jgi:sialate O-acetylesterase